MKDNLSRKIIKEFFGVRARTSSYLIDDGSKDKKAKSAKMCFIKRKLKFANHKKCLKANQLKNKIKHLEKMKLT